MSNGLGEYTITRNMNYIFNPGQNLPHLRFLLDWGFKFSTLKKVNKAKKLPVFRVTWPYLNLLMKPRFFFMFSGKNIILCVLKSKLPFKRHKVIFFQKIIQKRNCMPTLSYIFRPVTHLYFYLASWKSRFILLYHPCLKQTTPEKENLMFIWTNMFLFFMWLVSLACNSSEIPGLICIETKTTTIL